MSAIADFKADIDAIGRIASVPLILDVVCRVTGMGFAAVARVTEDRWIACQVKDEIAFGLKPGGELEVETTLCNEIRASRQPIVIDHVAEDAQFCGHHTPARYGFQSYISMPIVRRDGSFFGTLCAIDPKPAKLKDQPVVGMFKLFAELIANHLDADEQLAAAQTALAKERSLSELREQFVAVLGHDLRNPLAAVHSGAALLRRGPLDEKGHAIPAAMTGSLFLPFFRGSQNDRQGLGLGLYIAAEIARAHGGTLDVSSTPAETRFTFRMPL